jgi:hypothetical protein
MNYELIMQFCYEVIEIQFNYENIKNELLRVGSRICRKRRKWFPTFPTFTLSYELIL